MELSSKLPSRFASWFECQTGMQLTALSPNLFFAVLFFVPARTSLQYFKAQEKSHIRFLVKWPLSICLPPSTWMTLLVLQNYEHRSKQYNRQLILQHTSAPLHSLVRLSLHPFFVTLQFAPNAESISQAAVCRFGHPHHRAEHIFRIHRRSATSFLQ